MLRPKLLAFLAALPLVAVPTAFAVRGPQGPDLGRLVQEQALRLSERPGEEIWQQVRALVDLARQIEGQDLAAAVDPLIADPSKLSPNGKIFAIALRLQAGDPDVAKLAGILTPLLASDKPAVALAAAQLSSDARFKLLGEDERKALVSPLAKLAQEGSRAPDLRLECAIGLYTLGSADERKDAWRVMNGFLTSQDPELRQQGALALARTNTEITGTLRDELKRMAAVPGDRGRMAQAYLEASRAEEYANNKFRRMADLMEQKNSEPTLDAGDPAAIFKTVMRVIQQGHLEGDKVKQDDLLDAALNGMLHSMDEHSTYMDSKYFQKFEQELEAEYGGIGAYVATDENGDGLFTITRPIYSGPAYKARLMSDDKIVRIDDWPTLKQPQEEVIKRLKGRPGTKVKLYIWRRGMEIGKIDRPTDDMIVEVERAKIQIPTVQWQMLPGKVGLISLLEFSRVAAEEERKALIDLQEQGMKALILDLRGNPGGLLDEAVAVATPFLPRGTTVVSTESRIEPGEIHKTQENPMVPADLPMAVLVNRFSASAAEIVSGALQDTGRAVIVGQRSFGKGSVQKLLKVPGLEDDKYTDENKNGRHDNWEPLTKDWNKNGEFDFAPHIKLTVSRYLLPSGRSIHRELDKDGNIIPGHRGGIDPDVAVESRTYEVWRIEEMQRLQQANKIRDYVDERWNANKDLFTQLAENDQRETSRYPDFDAFMAKLATPIPADDVRQLIRMELRRRVQDMRGKEYPGGDFVEDVQLQEAIRVALEKLGRTPGEFPEYKSAIPPTTRGRVQIAKVERQSLEEALEQLKLAKTSDGKLSPEVIERLQEMLQASLDGGH